MMPEGLGFRPGSAVRLRGHDPGREPGDRIVSPYPMEKGQYDARGTVKMSLHRNGFFKIVSRVVSQIVSRPGASSPGLQPYRAF